jgi:hypothetical protein
MEAPGRGEVGRRRIANGSAAETGQEQTGLGGVGKIMVRLLDARTGLRGSGEQANNMVVLGHVLNL